MSSNDKKKKEKKKLSNATKVITVLTFIGVVGILFGYFNKYLEPQTVIVDIPIVRSSSMSSSRNESRNVSTDFSIELDRRTANRVNIDQVYQEIHQVMTTIDHDIIIGPNNINLIRDEVHAHLSTIFDDDELIAVYITDIFNDGFEPPPWSR